MTDAAGPSELLTGKPSVAVEFLVWLPLARIRDRISGNEIINLDRLQSGALPDAVPGTLSVGTRHPTQPLPRLAGLEQYGLDIRQAWRL